MFGGKMGRGNISQKYGEAKVVESKEWQDGEVERFCDLGKKQRRRRKQQENLKDEHQLPLACSRRHILKCVLIPEIY